MGILAQATVGVLAQETTVEGPGFNDPRGASPWRCSALVSLWVLPNPLVCPFPRERLQTMWEAWLEPCCSTLVGRGDGFVRSEHRATQVVSNEGSELLYFCCGSVHGAFLPSAERGNLYELCAHMLMV